MIFVGDGVNDAPALTSAEAVASYICICRALGCVWVGGRPLQLRTFAPL